MINDILNVITRTFNNIAEYYNTPLKVVALVIDIAIVVLLIVKFFQLIKGTRVWQLLKGIILLIIATALSNLLKLRILNYILTSVMTYGVILIIVIFQPELRRALEQLRYKQNFKIFWV